MKKLLLFLALIGAAKLGLCDTGDVTAINTVSPKNNAFQYIVRSTNVFVSTANFSGNLGPSDVNLQHAMQTINALSIGSGGGSITIATGNASGYTAPATSTRAATVIFDSATISVTPLPNGTTVFVSLAPGVIGGSNGTIFAMTASSSATNSTAETNVVGAGSGTVIIPANYLQVGKTLRVLASGIYTSTTTSGIITIKLKLGPTVICSTNSFSLVDNQTNQLWRFGVAATVRSAGSSGTIFSNTAFQMYDTTNGMRTFPMVSTSPVTVDMTTTQAIQFTAQFGTANSSNTFTVTNFVVVGETVTTLGGISSGSSTPCGGLGSVQFSSVTTCGGDTGFQYDASVSSVTGNGKMGFNLNGTSLRYDDSSGAGDPLLNLDDSSGSPGGGLFMSEFGIVKFKWTNSAATFQLQVASGSALSAIPRMNFPKDSQKTQWLNASANVVAEIDPIVNSSFTIPVAMNAGFSTTSGTFTALSPGVMHITATSSATVTGLVLSTEASTNLRRSGLPMSFDNGASVLVTSTRSFTLPFDFTLSTWTITCSSGSVAIHVSSSSVSDYKLGNYYNISAAGNSPSVTSNVYNGAQLSGWSQTVFSAGDVISFILDTATTSTWAIIEIWGLR